MKRCLTLLVATLLVAACTSTVVPPPKKGEYYYNEGERFFDKELYDDAIASWEKVRDSYYSADLTTKAELKIAEAHFLAEHYLEAAIAFESFLKNHPDHPETANVLFSLGQSYFRQFLKADQDQTATHNARTTLRNFLLRFPEHDRIAEAEAMVKQSNNLLAAHDIYVGRFYMRTKQYQAAISRLAPVFELYPDAAQLDSAWYYLGLAYLRSGQSEKAAEAFNALFRNYPESKFVRKGQKVLAKEF